MKRKPATRTRESYMRRDTREQEVLFSDYGDALAVAEDAAGQGSSAAAVASLKQMESPSGRMIAGGKRAAKQINLSEHLAAGRSLSSSSFAQPPPPTSTATPKEDDARNAYPILAGNTGAIASTSGPDIISGTLGHAGPSVKAKGKMKASTRKNDAGVPAVTAGSTSRQTTYKAISKKASGMNVTGMKKRTWMQTATKPGESLRMPEAQHEGSGHLAARDGEDDVKGNEVDGAEEKGDGLDSGQGRHAHPNNLDAGPSRDTQKDEDVLAGYEADTYGQLLDVTEPHGLLKLPPKTLLMLTYNHSCNKAPEEPKAANLASYLLVEDEPLAQQPETTVYACQQGDCLEIAWDGAKGEGLKGGDVYGALKNSGQVREIIKPRAGAMRVAAKIQFMGPGINDRMSTAYSTSKEIRQQMRDTIPSAKRDRDIVGPILAFGTFAYLIPGEDTWATGYCRISLSPLYASYSASKKDAIDNKDLARYKRLVAETYSTIALFNEFRVHYDLKPENICLEQYEAQDGNITERVILIDIEGAKKKTEVVEPAITTFVNTWGYSSVPLIGSKIAQVLRASHEDFDVLTKATAIANQLDSASYCWVLPQADQWALGIILLADMCPRFHEVVYTVGQFMFDIVHCPLTGIERLDFIQKKIRQLAKIFSFTYDHDLWKKELDKPGNMFKDKELVALLKGCLKRPEVLGILTRVETLEDIRHMHDLYQNLQESIVDTTVGTLALSQQTNTSRATKTPRTLVGIALSNREAKERRHVALDPVVNAAGVTDRTTYLIRRRPARLEWSDDRGAHCIILEGKHCIESNAVIYIRPSGLEMDFVNTKNEKGHAFRYRCNKHVGPGPFDRCPVTTTTTSAASNHAKTCCGDGTSIKIKTSSQFPSARGPNSLLAPAPSDLYTVDVDNFNKNLPAKHQPKAAGSQSGQNGSSSKL